MDIEVKRKFDSYPSEIRSVLFDIRRYIFEVAQADDIGIVTETLKWGELAYLAPNGSTVRINWASEVSDSLSVYFNCKTRLVETFIEIFPDTFQFVGSRELILPALRDIPIPELKVCISMSLRYHKIKHLPLLGA